MNTSTTIRHLILDSTSMGTLSSQIEEMSAKGWKLYGDLVIVKFSGNAGYTQEELFYHQAMIKEQTTWEEHK